MNLPCDHEQTNLAKLRAIIARDCEAGTELAVLKAGCLSLTEGSWP